MNEQTRGSDFEIFAGDLKRAAVGTDSCAAPLSTGTQLRLKFGASVHTRLSPPQQDLLGIDERLKDTLWRYGHLDLTRDLILIGRNSHCSCVRQRILLDYFSRNFFNCSTT